jgi:hypothetical protein
MERLKIEGLRLLELGAATCAGIAVLMAVYNGLSLQVWVMIVIAALIAIAASTGRDRIVGEQASAEIDAIRAELAAAARAARPPTGRAEPARTVIPRQLIEAHQRLIATIQEAARAASESETQSADIVTMLTDVNAYVARLEDERNAYRQAADEERAKIAQIVGIVGSAGMAPMTGTSDFAIQEARFQSGDGYGVNLGGGGAEPGQGFDDPIPGFLAGRPSAGPARTAGAFSGPAATQGPEAYAPRPRRPEDVALRAIADALDQPGIPKPA